MNLTKFDYVVDTTIPLVVLGDEANKILSGMCPVIVGRLTEHASRLTNAELVITTDSAAQMLDIASLLKGLGEEVPADIELAVARAFVTLNIASAELAKRYVAGTLDPIYHVGTDAAIEHARKTVADQKAAQGYSQQAIQAI